MNISRVFISIILKGAIDKSKLVQEIIFQDFVENSWGWTYIGFGVFIALIELITLVFACAYAAQIDRLNYFYTKCDFVSTVSRQIFQKILNL